MRAEAQHMLPYSWTKDLMATYGEVARSEAWRTEFPRETKIRPHVLDALK